MKHFAIALSLCLGLSTGALAEVRYSVSGVETADGYADSIMAINKHGAVTGSFMSGGTQEAFVFGGGTVTRLGNGGASGGVGRVITDNGVVGGMFGTLGFAGDFRPFLFDGATTLDLAATHPDLASTYVTDINEAGKVLLYGVFLRTQPTVEFVTKNFRYENGDVTNLLPPGSQKYWLALNDNGGFSGSVQIGAVQSPFVDNGAGTIVLPSQASGPGTAVSLNQSGWATGATTTATGGHAFLYNGQSTIDLGTLRSAPPYSYFESGGLSINNLGVVVGFSETDSAGMHAFLYGTDGMEDLNGLIDPASGWVLQAAQGINDSGQIVGFGTFNGQQRGFILNPLAAVPEPASWAMMIGGFALVGAGLRRRSQRGAVRYAVS